MWHRFALILCVAGVAGVAGTPARAQQPGAEAKLQQEIEAVLNDWLEALNRGDGKAAVAFFVPNAPVINPAGLVHGGPEYVNRVELRQNAKTVAKIDRVQGVGSDAAYAFGPWNTSGGPGGASQGGVWLQLYESHAAVR